MSPLESCALAHHVAYSLARRLFAAPLRAVPFSLRQSSSLHRRRRTSMLVRHSSCIDFRARLLNGLIVICAHLFVTVTDSLARYFDICVDARLLYEIRAMLTGPLF